MTTRHYPSRSDLQQPDKLERVVRDIYDRIYNREPSVIATGGGQSRISTAVSPLVGTTLHSKNVFPPAGSPITNPTTLTVTTVTSGATSVYDTYQIILCDASGGAITLNLPAAASLIGKVFEIKKIDSTANTVTIDPSGAEQIEGDTTAQLSFEGECLTIICDATEWWII